MINNITETRRLLRETRKELKILNTVQLNSFYVADSDVPITYDEYTEYIKDLINSITILVEDTEGRKYSISNNDMAKFSSKCAKEEALLHLNMWKNIYTADLHFGTIARDINKKYKLKCRGCGSPVKLYIDFYYTTRNDGTPYSIKGKVSCNKCWFSYASKRMEVSHYSSKGRGSGNLYYAYKDIGEKDLVHMWDDYIKKV